MSLNFYTDKEDRKRPCAVENNRFWIQTQTKNIRNYLHFPYTMTKFRDVASAPCSASGLTPLAQIYISHDVDVMASLLGRLSFSAEGFFRQFFFQHIAITLVHTIQQFELSPFLACVFFSIFSCTHQNRKYYFTKFFSRFFFVRLG